MKTCILCILAFPVFVAADIIRVPEDISVIQDAIEQAQPNDEIVLAPGIHYGVIDFLGKAITVRSTDPDDSAVVAATIIDGTGRWDSVVKCVSGENADTVLSGITIRHGGRDDRYDFSVSDGGGMLNINSEPTVSNCMFLENSACTGGGMCNIDSSPVVINCIFKNNSAIVGGGMANGSSSPTIDRCTFSENRAHSGGGIANSFSSSNVNNCVFFENGATYTVYRGYGYDDSYDRFCFLEHENGYGGGIYNLHSSSIIRNCTFVENGATEGGGGVHNDENSYNVTTVITNSILWNNYPDTLSGQMGQFNVVYSNIRETRDWINNELEEKVWVGTGNINANPYFLNASGGNFRLFGDSPCVDTGLYYYDLSEDRDGNPRVVNEQIDMGAFEFQGCDGEDFDGDEVPDLCDSDIDNDGVFNNHDVCDFTFEGVITNPKGRPIADLNLDCEVNLQDYAILQNSMR